MKKVLLSVFALFAFQANAQIADGSTAPDFTVTDVYGNSHTLSSYLNDGKHVLLNISATWCGPCWNYHNTHALGDFYKAYGPTGSDEAMVLYIEGDGSTPVTAIFGEGNNTWGDWTEGTPYPIIDAASVASAYQIAYFPTLFRICANTGTTMELNQLTAPNLRNNLNSSCSTLTGVANHVEITVGSIYTCDTTTNVSAKLKNFGNNGINEAIVVLKENGNVVATSTYNSVSGDVAQFSSVTMTFENVEINPESSYSVEVQSVNGGTIHHAPYGTAEISEIIVANTAEHVNLQVNVYTDSYPGEARWRVKDSNGAIIASGGPYQGNGSSSGGPDANTVKTHNISVAPSECYTVELLDQYGDGWGLPSSSNPNTPGLEVLRDGNSIVVINGTGMFSNTAPLIRPAAFKTASTLGVENLQVTEFSVYPNPSTGVFNINTSEMVNIKVVDITGKVVYQAQNIDNTAVVNLSSLQKGVYLMQVSGETIQKIEKLILN
ncbi:MAG: T9SS type A sorting domain-containing protein [Flavobacteriaceae bacterium]